MNTQQVPLNSLDLIPWRPSPPPPPPPQDAFHLNPHIWSRLPENLLHSVLELLPFQCVLRFRCVCKQWKALFASPAFHHFASHKAHVPPLIFFFGSSTRSANNGAVDHSDDGYEDEGYAVDDPDGNLSDESISDDNDEDSNDVNGYEFHDAMRYGNHGNIEHGGMHNVMRYGDHANVPDFMRYGNQDLHDVLRYGDHGDMYDVIRYDDLRQDMHDGNHLAIHDANHLDDDFSKCHVNAQEAPVVHTDIEPLLLIFDCESESWRSPLALPPGFRRTSNGFCLARFNVCTFEEQLLIPVISPNLVLLFNPASPPFKELPPCIAIQNLEALGFVEDKATLPGDATSSNLSNLFSMSNEKEPHAQDKTAKILKIVAVGDTVNDTNIVESFDSVSGSWHVIGRLPQSDHFIFAQARMMHCKGYFYGLLPNGIIIMSNVLKGQNMKWKYREYPDIPFRDGDSSGRYPQLMEQHLVATKESVFMVGVTFTLFTTPYVKEDLDILIWQIHPDAGADACWELLANMPSRTRETLIGGVTDIDCRAHGDSIFLSMPGSQRFVIYDVPRKLWRFSAKCKYFLNSMAFVWEPLLRN